MKTPRELLRVLREKTAFLPAPATWFQNLDPIETDAFYYSIRKRIVTRYWKAFGRKPNLCNPQLYSEKVQWRKLYCPQVELLGRVTDKVGVYEYIREKLGNDHLLPILWLGDKFDEETLRSLGDQIVLQPTHRSGQVVFIEKSEYILYEELSKWLHRMLRQPYSMLGQEPWYGRIHPQIVARPLVRNPDGTPYLNDCKFHLFKQKDGSTKVICEIINTYPHWRAIFDENFKRLPFDWSPDTYPPPQDNPEKPKQFEEMLADAQVLSSDFDYVRVDFMMGAEEYYFTELTFAPAGGHPEITPPEWDKIVGSYWDLDTGNMFKRFFWKTRAWLPLWKTERPMRNILRLYRYKQSEWAIRGIRQIDYDSRYSDAH